MNQAELYKILKRWFNGSMSAEKSIRFDVEEKRGYLGIQSRTSRVDLNSLMKRIKEEEKKTKRNNLAISAAVLSAVVVFGIILTL